MHFLSHSDILAGNEQLAAELAFDIRKFEEMQALEVAEQLAASVQIGSGDATPGNVVEGGK